MQKTGAQSFLGRLGVEVVKDEAERDSLEATEGKRCLVLETESGAPQYFQYKENSWVAAEVKKFQIFTPTEESE